MGEIFLLNPVTFLINSPLGLDIEGSTFFSFDLLFRFQGNGKGKVVDNVFFYKFIEEGRLSDYPLVVSSVKDYEEVLSLCILVRGGEGYIHFLYEDYFCSRP